MEISKPNQNGVLESGHHEIVASHGRAFAAIDIALCEAGLYRFATAHRFCHGGHGGPIFMTQNGYETFVAARIAALEELLSRHLNALWWQPQHANEEIRLLREQVESQLRQPSLF